LNRSYQTAPGEKLLIAGHTGVVGALGFASPRVEVTLLLNVVLTV
jgi:hypothetical protein